MRHSPRATLSDTLVPNTTLFRSQGRRQPMGMTDLTSILPLLVLAAAAVLLIMAIAIRRNHLLMYLLTLFSLTVAFIALFPAARLIPRIIDPLFIDRKSTRLHSSH